MDVYFENLNECVRSPSFDWTDTVEFTPGRFDPERAVFAVEVKGVRFLKRGRDALWMPTNRDFIIGVGSFVDSSEYRVCGGAPIARHDREVAMRVTLKILSELLDRVTDVKRLYDFEYGDFKWLYYDYLCITEYDAGVSDVYCDNGQWRKKKADDGIPENCVVSLSAFVISKLTGMGVDEAKGSVFVRYSKDMILKFRKELKCYNPEADREFCKLTWLTQKDRSYYLLLSESSAREVVSLAERTNRENAMRIAHEICEKCKTELGRRRHCGF